MLYIKVLKCVSNSNTIIGGNCLNRTNQSAQQLYLSLVPIEHKVIISKSISTLKPVTRIEYNTCMGYTCVIYILHTVMSVIYLHYRRICLASAGVDSTGQYGHLILK